MNTSHRYQALHSNVLDMVDHTLPVALKLGFLLFMAAVLSLAFWLEQYVAVGGLCAAGTAIVLMIKYPRLWLYGSVLLWVVWFRSSDKSLSMLDIGMVGFYLGGLATWFLGAIINRQKIIWSMADRFIIAFFVLGLANSAIAWLNGVSLLIWGREFLLLVFLLYYFPVKALIYTRRHLVVFISFTGCVIFALGIANLQLYLAATKNAVYAFNILSSRVSLNETIFLGASLCSTSILLFSKRWHHRLALLGLTVFYSTVLIASFTRGAWLAFIIGIMLIFFLVETRQRIALVSYLMLSVLSLVVVVSVAFSSISNFVFHSIESRFTSSAKGTNDISVNSRVKESEATIRGIVKYPLGGAGMGAPIVFYDIIEQYTSSPTFLHNGYLFLSYKMGIPLALLFVIGMLLYLVKGGYWAYRARQPFYKCIAIGASVSLFAALLISITSNQFALRHGLSLLAVYIALIAIVERLELQSRKAELDDDLVLSTNAARALP